MPFFACQADRVSGEGDQVGETIELAVLRDVRAGAQIDHEALAWEIPGADVRQVAAAVHRLIENGDLRFSPGTRRPHAMELGLSGRGRKRLGQDD